jgi:hypothetical protein
MRPKLLIGNNLPAERIEFNTPSEDTDGADATTPS